MFIVKAHNETQENLSLLISSLEAVGLREKTHIHCVVNRANIVTITGNICDSVLVDLSDTDTDVDFDDVVMDIIETQTTVVIHIPNKEIKTQFTEVAELYGLDYIDYDTASLNSEPKIDNIIDYVIVDEIFNGSNHVNLLHSYLDYLVSVDMLDGCIVLDGDSYPLETFNFASLYGKLDQSLMERLMHNDSQFNSYVVTPLPFVLDSSIESACKKIETYKLEVFKKIANLSPRELTSLPIEVLDIVIRGGYVPLDKIKELTSTVN